MDKIEKEISELRKDTEKLLKIFSQHDNNKEDAPTSKNPRATRPTCGSP
jgi:hypothetical protein